MININDTYTHKLSVIAREVRMYLFFAMSNMIGSLKLRADWLEFNLKVSDWTLASEREREENKLCSEYSKNSWQFMHWI